MEHPRHFRRIAMLEMLRRLQDLSEEQGNPDLFLEFYRSSDGNRRLEYREHRPGGRKILVPDALGVTGAQAIGTLQELADNGFVKLRTPANGLAFSGLVGVTILDKGLQTLGELPDPRDDLDERLDERLDVLVEAIRARSDVPDDDKTLAETFREEAKTFGRGFAQATAVQIARTLAAQYGIPIA
jgi:hypothetical protein